MRMIDKVVLVVGAGEHLGRSAPLLFAQEGAKVVISARREAVLDETAQMIRSRGGQAAVCVGSAARMEDAARMVQTAVDQFGRLDVLYNNIGGGWVELDKKLHEMSQEAYDTIVASNLTAVFNACKAAIMQFLKQGGGGVIVNVSASDHVRRMANPVYAYTKAGIIEMTRNLANDYLDDRIRVNALGPGLFDYRPVKDPIVTPNPVNLLRLQPKTARQGVPSDLAFAGLFLASDESSFITGQYLVVDGGDDMKLTDLVLD